MTPERWHQVRDVLAHALELKPEDRPAFLDRACSSDRGLRKEVELLLSSSEEARSSFLQSAAMRVTLMPGAKLGDYEVQRLLGSGGMGEVYRARDTRLARDVAIKVLPAFLSQDPDRLRRFEQEARAAAALNHPNILAVFQMGTYECAPYLVSELLEGSTLREQLVRGAMPLRKAIDCGVQIARGLSAAHEKGIVHRDLKPENLFVAKDGRAKILDFGLAKLVQRRTTFDDSTITANSGTQPGVVMGTIGYMSPEQVRGNAADHRADIFAFGAILYEMLTGKRAFQKPTSAETMSATLNEDPPGISQLASSTPLALQRIVHRCLEKNPGQRFQSASDLAFALEALSDSGVQSAIAPVQPERLEKRKWWYATATAITLLALASGVGTLWFARSAHKASEPTVTVVPLTTYPGFQRDPSFSPDGNQVAFAWEGYKQDNVDVYVKLIGTNGPPLRLTTDAMPDYSPAWSPDGRFIAFLRESREKIAVILIPALGGPERKIAEVHKALSELPGPYLAWSPEGNSLVICDKDSPADPFALFLLLIETGEKRRLTSPPPSSVGDTSPAFSPDGHTLAFSRHADMDIDLGDLYMLNLVVTAEGLKPAGDVQRVTFENRGARSPAWTSDGREIVFSDRLGAWRISPSASAQPQQIISLGSNVSTIAVSRHGQRLIYKHNILHANIWHLIAPFADGSRKGGYGRNPQSSSSAVSFISSTRSDSSPQYSGDGKKIAFTSDRSGHPEIWLCDSNGSNAQQLTSFNGPQVTSPRWSPDAARIAFDSDAEGEYDIFVIGANGGKPQRMTTHLANDGNPSWSRDGRWIYFDSARTGQQQVWKMPANGGEAIQVTRDGGLAPLESTDGKFVYYLKPVGQGFSFGSKTVAFRPAQPTDTDVWRISTDGAHVSRVLEGLSDYRNLAVVENGLIFVPTRNTSSLQFLNFVTGRITLLANFDRPMALGQIGGLAISPDDRSILYTKIQEGSELMLVENFR